MFLARLTGPDAVLPLIDTIASRKHPRAVIVVGEEIRTFQSGSARSAMPPYATSHRHKVA